MKNTLEKKSWMEIKERERDRSMIERRGRQKCERERKKR